MSILLSILAAAFVVVLGYYMDARAEIQHLRRCIDDRDRELEWWKEVAKSNKPL